MGEIWTSPVDQTGDAAAGWQVLRDLTTDDGLSPLRVQAALAAARREGWAQAIEALRALIREISEDDDMHDPKTSYPNCLGCKWRTTLTDRAAALTEEPNRD